jgi:hypothetical protein
MGQYYKVVSLDAEQYISPFGAKLVEHFWVDNTYMKQVERLLSPGGSWHKTRLVWAGDYADEALFVPEGFEKETLYSYAYNNYTLPPDGKEDGPDIRYVVNHSKNLYIDMEDIPNLEEEEDFKIHPLPILTSSGNGRGSGDYRDDDDTNIGSWAGDVISTEFIEPEHMEKYTEFFTEY